MKYLVIFESFIDMKQYLSDIFLDLEDEGYEVRISNNFGDIDGNNRIQINGNKFKLKDIFELILTADNYMTNNGWYINSMLFRTNSTEWFSLNHNDIIKLKEGEMFKELLVRFKISAIELSLRLLFKNLFHVDIDYIEIEFKKR